MKKNVKRINESQLRAIVAENVKKVLAEKYNPWKRNETDDGVEFPRYDKDVKPYREMLGKQAQHLYDQIEYFLQTLEHAYPNMPNAKNSNRSFYPYDDNLETNLRRAKLSLGGIVNLSGWGPDPDYSRDDYGY